MNSKNLTLIMAMLVLSSSYGQWNYDNQSIIYSNNAKVGVGTNAPSSKLHIYEAVQGGDAAITLQNRSTWDLNGTASLLFTHGVNNYDGSKITSIREGIYYSGNVNTASSSLAFYTSKNAVNNEQMRITSAGRMGLGTNDPSSKLHIYEVAQGGDAAITLQNRSTWDPNGTASLLFTHAVDNFAGGKITSIREGDYVTGTANTANSSLAFHTSKNASNIEHMRINSDGQVGIGTANVPIGYALAVAGKMISEEITVDLEGDWPDFVFEENYDLPSLQEVEIQINENGHLQNIPSAKTVKEHGIDLGAMDAKLLRKIEELMLYTIEQQKEIEVLKKELRDLKD